MASRKGTRENSESVQLRVDGHLLDVLVERFNGMFSEYVRLTRVGGAWDICRRVELSMRLAVVWASLEPLLNRAGVDFRLDVDTGQIIVGFGKSDHRTVQ